MEFESGGRTGGKQVSTLCTYSLAYLFTYFYEQERERATLGGGGGAMYDMSAEMQYYCNVIDSIYVAIAYLYCTSKGDRASTSRITCYNTVWTGKRYGIPRYYK